MSESVIEQGAIGYAIRECSLGRLLIAASERGICQVRFGDSERALEDDPEYIFLLNNDTLIHASALPQLADYLDAHDDVGDVVYRDTDSAATGEVVVQLIEELGLESLPEGSATPLYAAIVSDTGGFRYATTRPATLRLG